MTTGGTRYDAMAPRVFWEKIAGWDERYQGGDGMMTHTDKDRVRKKCEWTPPATKTFEKNKML